MMSPPSFTSLPPGLAAFQAEIAEQPTLLAALARHWASPQALPHPLQRILPNTTHILGMGEGSSLHALRMAQPWLTELTGCPCRINTAYEGTQLAQLLATHEQTIHPLVILVSQSGETASLVAAVEQLPAAWPIIVITNNPAGTLATHPRCVAALPINAGTETSIPATKTVTATLATLLGVGLQWQHLIKTETSAAITTEAFSLVDAITQTFQHLNTTNGHTFQGWAAEWMAEQANALRPVILLGPEPWLPVLQEIGLKWMETLGLTVLTYSLEGFLHGPRAMCCPKVGNNAIKPSVIVWLPTHNTALPAPLLATFTQSQVKTSFFLVSDYHFAHSVSPPAPPSASLSSLPAIHTPYWVGRVLGLGQWLTAALCQAGSVSPNHPLLTKAVTPAMIDISASKTL